MTRARLVNQLAFFGSVKNNEEPGKPREHDAQNSQSTESRIQVWSWIFCQHFILVRFAVDPLHEVGIHTGWDTLDSMTKISRFGLTELGPHTH